jgi:hypothetical protein
MVFEAIGICGCAIIVFAAGVSCGWILRGAYREDMNADSANVRRAQAQKDR